MVSVMIGNRRRLNNTINDLLQIFTYVIISYGSGIGIIKYIHSFRSFVRSVVSCFFFFFLSLLLLFRFGSVRSITSTCECTRCRLWHRWMECEDASGRTGVVLCWLVCGLAGPFCMIHFFCHGHEWQFRYTRTRYTYLYIYTHDGVLITWPYALRLHKTYEYNMDGMIENFL